MSTNIAYFKHVFIRTNRKRKYDDELSRMLWKIDFKDIEFRAENHGSKVGVLQMNNIRPVY